MNQRPYDKTIPLSQQSGGNTMKTIFVTDKRPVRIDNIPSGLDGYFPLIRKYEVIKQTAKGYRLKVNYSDKGSMHREENYCFFESYSEALEHIASEANRVAGKLEDMKHKAISLMCQAHDELRNNNKEPA